jgi:hypothetical protein
MAVSGIVFLLGLVLAILGARTISTPIVNLTGMTDWTNRGR